MGTSLVEVERKNGFEVGFQESSVSAMGELTWGADKLFLCILEKESKLGKRALL